MFLYRDLCSRDTVRYISGKYKNVEEFEKNYLIEGTLFEEAHHWKIFAENISEKSFLYKDCSFWGDAKGADLNVAVDKIISDIFHLSNQTKLPEFHNDDIGKSAIGKISELKKLPSEKIKERIVPRDRTSERIQMILEIMKENDMRQKIIEILNYGIINNRLLNGNAQFEIVEYEIPEMADSIIELIKGETIDNPELDSFTNPKQSMRKTE